MAPRIAKGKVIIGVAGGEFPTRGYFAAYDANTGRFAWRFYAVPGDPSKPFENDAMKKAAETWDGDWWKFGGGGSIWDGMAYDPDADLIYVGTGNGGPWPEQLRKSKGKDNLYVCSILAVKPDTSELQWYYQNTPGDSWDYDSVQGFVLADITINGRHRKVIMQANKNGFYYVLDRLNGSFISAQPFAQVNWARGIDPARTLLKIDTQGYEAPVLDGAGDLLSRFAAVSLELSFVPLYEGQQLYDQLTGRLRDAGFTLYCLDAGFGDPRTGRMLQCDGLFVRSDLVR